MPVKVNGTLCDADKWRGTTNSNTAKRNGALSYFVN